jgi:hypothetical protein
MSTTTFNIDEAIKPYEQMDTPVKGQKVVIYPTHVEVEMTNGSTKCISTGDFAAILSGTLQSEIETASILLPANCYYWAPSGNDLRLSCYYPGRLREIQYISRDDRKPAKHTIPFPNIVISHKLKRINDRWDWRESRYLATSRSISQLPLTFLWNENPEEQIWYMPFSNMHDGGVLCYGSNSVTRQFKDNFRGLDWHFGLLYSTPFNDDLGVRGTVNRFAPSGWYKELSNHKVFPYELLKHGKKIVESKSVSSNIFDVQLETA